MTVDPAGSIEADGRTTDSGWWSERLGADPAVRRLLDLVAEGGEVSARGAAGSSTSVLAAAIARRAPGPVVLVVPHLDDADDAVDELLDIGVDAVAFPALEVMPGERAPAVDLVAARLGLLRRLESGEAPAVIVAGAKTHSAFVPGSAAHKAAAKDALMGGLGPTAEIMALDA